MTVQDIIDQAREAYDSGLVKPGIGVYDPKETTACAFGAAALLKLKKKGGQPTPSAVINEALRLFDEVGEKPIALCFASFDFGFINLSVTSSYPRLICHSLYEFGKEMRQKYTPRNH